MHLQVHMPGHDGYTQFSEWNSSYSFHPPAHSSCMKTHISLALIAGAMHANFLHFTQSSWILLLFRQHLLLPLLHCIYRIDCAWKCAFKEKNEALQTEIIMNLNISTTFSLYAPHLTLSNSIMHSVFFHSFYLLTRLNLSLYSNLLIFVVRMHMLLYLE